MSKYLVTGGAGFIGSHIVEFLLSRNHSVTVLDNLSNGKLENLGFAEKYTKKFSFINGDVINIATLINPREKFDCIFHLAALADIVPSVQKPSEYYNSNCTGTLALMEFCKISKSSKVVYAASSSCYGIPSTIPTSEKSELNPRYPYALTKMIGEQIVLHWGAVYDIDVISLRLFNVFGKRARTSGTYGAVFGVFLAQKAHDVPLTIVGDGSQKRDFTHVSDVVNAFTKAADSDLSQCVFNVGSGEPKSVNEIVNLIKHRSVNIPKRPGEPDITWADVSKIKHELGWTPLSNFEEGVAELVNDLQVWENAPVWTPLKIENETKDWFKFIK
jgi:UDP-glucose 4-epimerase